MRPHLQKFLHANDGPHTPCKIGEVYGVDACCKSDAFCLNNSQQAGGSESLTAQQHRSKSKGQLLKSRNPCCFHLLCEKERASSTGILWGCAPGMPGRDARCKEATPTYLEGPSHWYKTVQFCKLHPYASKPVLGARTARSCKWTNRSIACRLCAKLCSGKLLGQKIERWSGQSSWPTWWLCWVLALPFRIAMPLATNNPARARRAPSGFLPKFFPSKKSQDSKKSSEISKHAKTRCFRWQRSKQPATIKTASCANVHTFLFGGNVLNVKIHLSRKPWSPHQDGPKSIKHLIQRDPFQVLVTMQSQLSRGQFDRSGHAYKNLA